MKSPPLSVVLLAAAVALPVMADDLGGGAAAMPAAQVPAAMLKGAVGDELRDLAGLSWAAAPLGGRGAVSVKRPRPVLVAGQSAGGGHPGKEPAGTTPAAQARTQDDQPAEAAGGQAAGPKSDGHRPDGAHDAPPTAPADPVELVRTLQSLQDQMAQGSARALAAQRPLLARLDQAFALTPPEVWREKRNAEAAVIYALSGGNPVLLRRLAKLDPPPAVERDILLGALAYAEGRVQEAIGRLEKVEIDGLSIGLGAQLAMVRAAVTVASDSGGAVALLDRVRLLAPGTLLEEAALRREIFVLAETGQTDKFERLCRQYIHRFRNSVYAGNFMRRFGAALTRLNFVDDEDGFRRLDDLMAELPPADREELYLLVARAAVAEGKTAGARLAAERALALTEEDQSRARLYRAAALAVEPGRLDEAAADLQAVRPERLSPADADLRRAVSRIVEAIETAAEASPPSTRAAPTAEGPPLPSLKSLSRAEAALAEVDKLLEKAPE